MQLRLLIHCIPFMFFFVYMSMWKKSSVVCIFRSCQAKTKAAAEAAAASKKKEAEEAAAKTEAAKVKAAADEVKFHAHCFVGHQDRLTLECFVFVAGDCALVFFVVYFLLLFQYILLSLCMFLGLHKAVPSLCGLSLSAR